MLALVCTQPHALELRDLPEPVPGPDEVVVAVRAAGICGSDLAIVRGENPHVAWPLVPGHELAGVRVDTGAAVAVNPLLSCGRCELCRQGRENLCRSRRLVGIHRAGGFAERVALPRAALPPAGRLDDARAALAEPFANAVHALRLARRHDPRPQRVGVLGAGAIGLATALVARACGVPEVIVCARPGARREAAAGAGLTTVDALEGEFDVVVDAVGVAATRGASVARLRPGGIAVWVGLHDAEPDFDARALVRGEQLVAGAYAYAARDFEAALELLADVATDWVARVPLADGVAAFAALRDGAAPATKTLLVPDPSTIDPR